MRPGESKPINRSNWLERLPEALREDVLNSCVRLKYKRGRHLFRQGDPANGIYCILTGEAQVVGTTITGLDILVSVLRANDWTGYLACTDKGNYTFSVIASQPCEVLHVPLAAVRRIFMSDADAFRLFVLPEIASTRATYQHFVENLAFTPLQRLARRLIDLTSAPHGEERVSDFISPITQDQLALSIMTSRQWANRLLQHMEQAKLIAISRGRIDILNRDALLTLAVHGESGFTVAEPADSAAEDLPRDPA
ncbi:Crp/Fnr family transcriptional regulator [Hyphomonas sp.]|uniref:Crp/Fnr family transcriptional regulator n=1 Tax=Hyphomonas sp. TaxID=87 RepID=UPI00391AC89D